MIIELIRYYKSPLYWLVLSVGLSVRAILAYCDSRHRGNDFWVLSGEFWSRIGSVTIGFLVLLVLIHLFSVDRETATFSTINSTSYGRITLFRNRLIAGCIAASVGTALLAFGNCVLSAFFACGSPIPRGWYDLFIRTTVVVLAGTIGFFIFAACVCDIFKNQTAAICICGSPFAFSYFLNASMLKDFELLWFLRYGFFTELIRGRLIHSAPVFWIKWYTLLLGGLLLITIHRRKEHKEL